MDDTLAGPLIREMPNGSSRQLLLLMSERLMSVSGSIPMQSRRVGDHPGRCCASG